MFTPQALKVAQLFNLDLSLFAEVIIHSTVAIPPAAPQTVVDEFTNALHDDFDKRLGSVIRLGGHRVSPITTFVVSHSQSDNGIGRLTIEVRVLEKIATT